MLCLTRKVQESIQIGSDIRIVLIRIKGGAVRIGVDAPKCVKVMRGELLTKDEKQEPAPDEKQEPAP